MTLTRRLCIAAGLAACACHVQASEELARKSGCLACHAFERKVIGPAFRDIAAKYKGNAAAEAMLVEKLGKGGAGVWGEIFMPPMSTLPERDIRVLVKWILSSKQGPAG